MMTDDDTPVTPFDVRQSLQDLLVRLADSIEASDPDAAEKVDTVSTLTVALADFQRAGVTVRQFLQGREGQ